MTFSHYQYTHGHSHCNLCRFMNNMYLVTSFNLTLDNPYKVGNTVRAHAQDCNIGYFSPLSHMAYRSIVMLDWCGKIYEWMRILLRDFEMYMYVIRCAGKLVFKWARRRIENRRGITTIEVNETWNIEYKILENKKFDFKYLIHLIKILFNYLANLCYKVIRYI